MPYYPERGDFVWIDMDPQAGREQAGRRPALVLSTMGYNRRVGLALFCPVTSQVKGYQVEVAIPTGLSVTGVVLSDHVKSLDWRARDVAFIGKAPESVIAEVQDKLSSLINS